MMHTVHYTLSLHDALPISAVENLDPATLEIADKQPRPQRGLRNGNSLVDGLSRMVHLDRKSTRLNSSHTVISYAVFCLKKKKKKINLIDKNNNFTDI